MVESREDQEEGLGKLSGGGREECGCWLTSLSPGLPHQSLWSGILPTLRKCLLAHAGVCLVLRGLPGAGIA